MAKRSHGQDSKIPTDLRKQLCRLLLCIDVEVAEVVAAAEMDPVVRLAALLGSVVEAALAMEVAEDESGEEVKAEVEMVAEVEKGVELRVEETAAVAEAVAQVEEGMALVALDLEAAAGLAQVEQVAVD